MAILSLQHVNIATTDLQKTVDFYVELLGMTKGDRPPVQLPGAWILSGDDPIVHLISSDILPGNTTGLDHIALEADDFEGTTARLEAKGIQFVTVDTPERSLKQVFFFDPNGVRLELNFQT